MKFIIGLLVVMTMMFLSQLGMASDAIVPAIVQSGFDKFLDILQNISSFMDAQKSIIGLVLGVLFSLSKAISNEKAPWVVEKIQMIFDMIAKLFKGLGIICEKISTFVSELIKSDGLLGKK